MSSKLFGSFILIFLSMFLSIAILAQPKKTSLYKAGQIFKDCPRCPEMILIPAGSFIMGSAEDELGHYPEESLQRRINIKQFAASKFDITKEQWAAFVKETNRATVNGCLGADSIKPWEFDTTLNWNHLGFAQDSTHPAVCISWYDVQDYINWLSKKTGFHYRLLSEAEWEYAARAGTKTSYWWGATASHEYANYGNDSCCSGLSSGKDKWAFSTSPVGSFPPNQFGLYDMNGNVMQWVDDCFDWPYSKSPTDGSAYKDSVKLKLDGDLSVMNETSSCDYHILRGGDFGDPPRLIRSASRNFAPSPGAPKLQNYRNAGVGFRIARTL